MKFNTSLYDIGSWNGSQFPSLMGLRIPSRLHIHSVIFFQVAGSHRAGSPAHGEPQLSSVLLCSFLGSGDSRHLASDLVTARS